LPLYASDQPAAGITADAFWKQQRAASERALAAVAATASSARVRRSADALKSGKDLLASDDEHDDDLTSDAETAVGAHDDDDDIEEEDDSQFRPVEDRHDMPDSGAPSGLDFGSDQSDNEDDDAFDLAKAQRHADASSNFAARARDRVDYARLIYESDGETIVPEETMTTPLSSGEIFERVVQRAAKFTDQDTSRPIASGPPASPLLPLFLYLISIVDQRCCPTDPSYRRIVVAVVTILVLPAFRSASPSSTRGIMASKPIVEKGITVLSSVLALWTYRTGSYLPSLIAAGVSIMYFVVAPKMGWIASDTAVKRELVCPLNKTTWSYFPLIKVTTLSPNTA
ncbi:hypothetical protein CAUPRSCDRAFT_12622, partial [Caulochytrium protostelioides]